MWIPSKTKKQILFGILASLSTGSLIAQKPSPMPPLRAPLAAPQQNPPAQNPATKELQEKALKFQSKELDLKLREVKFQESLSKERRKLQRMEIEDALKKKEKEQKNAKLLEEIETNKLKLQKIEQEQKLKTQESRITIEALAIENKIQEENLKKISQEFAKDQIKLNREKEKLATEQMKHKFKLEKVDTDLQLAQKKKVIKALVKTKIDYKKEPFQDGTLYISDRRIEMNGPIVYGTADYITDRIYFYNNKSEELPIFLVINRSPGGSVMEGYRIIKAMESSKAPIHVIVKSYAASMAAMITTLAEHSYAYESAIILHHQPAGVNRGNIAEQQKRVETLNEWAERLLRPVADKMGISLEEFYKRMYANDPNGNWREFGDKAQKLKWVKHIAQRVEEASFRESPDLLQKMKKQNDPKGKSELPELNAFDYYFIHGS